MKVTLHGGWLVATLLIWLVSSWAFADAAPDARLPASAIPGAPDIRFDYILADRFEPGIQQAGPRIEFVGDAMLLLSGPVASRQLGVRVYDQNGDLLPGAQVQWLSTSPDVSVTATGSLSAVVESDAWLTQPARVIAEHPGLGVSATAHVVMGTLAGQPRSC